LENIDDDAERYGIHFVKSTAVKTASKLGINPLPALVYFEAGQPIRYNGKRAVTKTKIFPDRVITISLVTNSPSNAAAMF